MKICPKCGCTKFRASQVQYWEVLVDGDGKIIESIDQFEEEEQYGPFICDDCGAQFIDWDEVPDGPDMITADMFKSAFDIGEAEILPREYEWTQNWVKIRIGKQTFTFSGLRILEAVQNNDIDGICSFLEKALGTPEMAECHSVTNHEWLMCAEFLDYIYS